MDPAHQLAVHHNAHADSVRHADEHAVIVCVSIATLRPDLRKCACSTRVFKMDGSSAELFFEHFDEWNFFPSELRSVDDNSGVAIYHSGEHDSDAVARRWRER